MLKIDLHCHLDGSLSRGCIEELLGRSVCMEELEVSADCQSLAKYLEKFDLPLACLQSCAGLERAGYDFMEQVSADGLDYVEVRFAPLLSTAGGLSCSQVIEAVLAGMELGKQRFGIPYGVIVCAMRHHTEEENLKMLRAARGYLGEGVCGADLAGNEAVFPMHDFISLFRDVKKLGMPFTIHAGECGSSQNIEEAILCGAGRIGHGIAMRGNVRIMELCRSEGIGIEMCPISNLQTKAVRSKAEYPLREFLDQGLKVTINTDNRMVSGTTIEKEIAFVREEYGISGTEVELMMKNAVETAFASDDVKHELLRKLA
ncbi:adenosine deaminase [Roseburia hominis]